MAKNEVLLILIKLNFVLGFGFFVFSFHSFYYAMKIEKQQNFLVYELTQPAHDKMHCMHFQDRVIPSIPLTIMQVLLRSRYQLTKQIEINPLGIWFTKNQLNEKPNAF